MKNLTIILLSIWALVIISCVSSDDKTTSTKTNKQVATQTSLHADNVSTKQENTKQEKVESSVIKVTGKGTTTEGGEVTIEMQWDDDKKITGKLVLQNKTLIVKGVVDGDTLRCWMKAQGDSPKTTYRGTLVGTLIGTTAKTPKKNSYQGTFAFSNSGAQEKYNGTWKSN